MNSLKIINFTIYPKLGCSSQERETPQEVRVSIDLHFQFQLQACKSDLLEDTLCYTKLCEITKNVGAKKEYFTIEHLSHSIKENLLPLIPRKTKICLHIHKVNPPIPGLRGGVIFEEEHFHE